MSRVPTSLLRPAYTLAVVLITCFLVLAFAAVLEGLVIQDWRRARQSALEACANEVIASAQAWSTLHGADLTAEQPVKLPTGEIVPVGTTGELELWRGVSATGEALVECGVSLQRAGQRLKRQAVWPLPAARDPHVETD